MKMEMGFQCRSVCSCARGRGLDNFKKWLFAVRKCFFFFFFFLL